MTIPTGRHTLTLLTLAAALLAIAPTPAHAGYALDVIPVPGLPAGYSPSAFDINNLGQVVINSLGSGPDIGVVYNINTHAYSAIPSGPGPVAGSVFAEALNDAGQFAGGYNLPSAPSIAQAFLYSGGTFTNVTPPAAYLSGFATALDISDGGSVVGVFQAPGQANDQGFLYSGGVFTTIDALPPADYATVAVGINNAGTIVGWDGPSSPSNNETGFVDVGGVFTSISMPGAVQTQAIDINDAGEIVGDFSPDNGDLSITSGFVDAGGVITPFNVPGAVSTDINAINNAGDLAGYYTDANGATFAYVAIPTVPETATTAALLAVSLLGLGLWRRLRRIGVPPRAEA